MHTAYDLAALSVSEENAVRGMLVELEELLELNSFSVLKDRYKYFRVDGTTERSYEERFYEIAPGKTLLAGIRHFNGARDQPFVHTLLAFRPSREDLDLIKNLARSNFSTFSPRHVQLWLGHASPVSLELEKLGLASRRYLVGRLSEIRKLRAPDRMDQIRLERVSEFDDNWYLESYADFHRASPELANRVPATDAKELALCLEQGLLFQIILEGQKAGLIGASSSPLFGYPAVYMTEFLLNSPFKGRGFAPAIQRKFLDALNPAFEFVWGTIDAQNPASTKTALSVGRKAIRSEFFLPL